MLDWGKYIAVADRFQYKAKWQDREDLRQDIILRLAQVARNNGHKPFTDRAMIRVASYVVADYWRKVKRKPTILSLDTEIENGDGDTTGLIQTIADDKAIDIGAWLGGLRSTKNSCHQHLSISGFTLRFYFATILSR